MNTLLIRKIYRTFILSWLISIPLYFALSLLVIRPFLRHYEHEIYDRVAPELGRQLVAGESAGRGAVQLFEMLQRFTPELEPYLLDERGTIVAARNPNTIGTSVPSEALRTELAEFRSDFPVCGFDPEGRNACPVVHAARTKLQGRDHVVYLLTRNGPAAYFSTTGGMIWIGRRLMLGFCFSLVLSLLFAAVVTKTYAKDILEFSSLLHAFSKLDFSRRFAARSADDLGRLGAAMNAMADTLDRRLKELSEAAIARKRLLARVVHDFRRPLSVMTLLLERAPKTAAAGDPGECAKLLEKMRNTLESERVILEGLEAVQEGGTASGEFPLPELIQELAQELSPLFQKKGVTLSVHVEAAPFAIPGDRGEFLRAFLNLLDNALQYTPSGGTVRVHLASENDLAIVSVEDSGIGIPKERWHTVFDPFERSPEARQMNPGGSGLGLSTVRDIFRKHGASLSIVSSEANAGTRFLCVLGTVRNRTVPTGADLGFTGDGKGDSGRIPSAGSFRRFYIFETFALAAFLLEELYSPQSAHTSRPAGWTAGTALSVVGLFVTRFLTRQHGFRVEGRRRLRILRAASLLTFGLLWITGPPNVYKPEIGGDVLVYLFSLGLLLGLAATASPVLTEALPAALPLLAGIVPIVLGPRAEIPLVLLSFCALCSFIIGLQAIPSTRRHHSRRLLGVLICLSELALLPHLYSFRNGWEDLLSRTSPFTVPDLPSKLSRELLAAGPNESDGLAYEAALRDRVYTISALNPRLDLRVFCGLRERRVCGYPPVSHLAGGPAEIARVSAIGRIPGIQQIERYRYSAVPFPGRPALSGVVSVESTISDKALRRVCEPYIVLFIMGAIGIAGFQTLFVFLACFERLRRGLGRVNRFVEALQRGAPIEDFGAERADDTGRMFRDIRELQARLTETEQAVLHERRETQQVIEVIARTLEKGRGRIVESMGLDREALRRMTAENVRAAAVVSEVFRYSLILADERARPVHDCDLRAVLSEAIGTAPPELKFETMIALEPAGAPQMVAVREDWVCTGIQLLFRSLLDEERLTSEPAAQICVAFGCAEVPVPGNERCLSVRAVLVPDVPLERDSLWMLGVKTLALGGIRTELVKDAAANELRAYLLFPAAGEGQPAAAFRETRHRAPGE